MDATWSHLQQLDPLIQDKALRFVNYARQSLRLPLVITSTRRSPEQQAALVAAGRSKTLQSKHLTGRAFDVDMLGWNRDAVPSWVWSELGPAGALFGLTWGGSWTSFRDVGHFEV
jgi:peptidoglycan L-alanyl-D-glutamate endopeptidase CwlK